MSFKIFNRNHNASFSSKPTWQPPQELNLQWTLIEGSGPFITIGQCTRPHFEASDTESDTTAIKSNLDSLNEDRPEVQCQGWDKGGIPESPNSYIESLVQRVNRGRFIFELGDSSDGPRLVNPQEEHNGPVQPNPLDTTQFCNEETNERHLDPFKLLTLGPGPSLSDINLPPLILTSDFWCCKVEFYQPSCWLYSVPNLLVF